ncbi:MAG: 1-acyl-sn-glycerol-3-phosphate acyltransferase [Crocinitomicaceae bacterium]|nr:1-acyl-sn-glycerol-3-phosphate acyltransferase [Crocinitomicaceae bacterium]
MARTFWAPGILKLAGVRSITTDGLDNIDSTKTYVVASNHLSYLDIPLLFKTLPFNLYFVGKKQLKRVPFLGWYMMLTGMFFIDNKNKRKTIESLNSAGKFIKEGKSILIFPEGTRSKTGEIGDFKKGAFILAAKSEVDILPVKITGTGKIWNVKHGTLKPGSVTVQILKSLPTNTVQNLAIITKRAITSV